MAKATNKPPVSLSEHPAVSESDLSVSQNLVHCDQFTIHQAFSMRGPAIGLQLQAISRCQSHLAGLADGQARQMLESDDANLLLTFDHKPLRRDAPQTTCLALAKPGSVLIEHENGFVSVEPWVTFLCVCQIDRFERCDSCVPRRPTDDGT